MVPFNAAEAVCLSSRSPDSLQAAFQIFLSCEALVKRLGNVKLVKLVNSRLVLRIAAVRPTPAAECRCFDVLSTWIYIQVALQTKNNTIFSTFATSFFMIPYIFDAFVFLAAPMH